ncbi:hypothetical protein ACFYU4_38565 [Streptomyces tendae]|uniref:hypothetical protein n=1 Tax=Streptomyces tendae TaxID=1932 RepID=UPI0036BA3408
MNACAYANSRPVTASDPEGKTLADDFTGLGYGNTTSYQKWGYRDSRGHTTQKYRNKLSKLNRSYSRYYNSSYYKKLQADSNEAARKAAQAEMRKKDGIWGNIKKGNWGEAWGQTKSGPKEAFTTWDGWKNKVLPATAFGACLIVSAGMCTAGGVLVVGTTFVGDGVTTGSGTMRRLARVWPGPSRAGLWQGDSPEVGEGRLL